MCSIGNNNKHYYDYVQALYADSESLRAGHLSADFQLHSSQPPALSRQLSDASAQLVKQSRASIGHKVS